MMKRSLTVKRVMIVAYLAVGAFLLAHTVNAFVAEALRPLPVQTSTPASIIPAEHDTESPRLLANAILTSRLFPLPLGASGPSASGQAAEPHIPPLDVAKKMALLGTVFSGQGGIMAIFEDLSTKKQTLYRVGDQIPAIGALSAIEKNRVLFREGQQEEWLNLALAQQIQSGAPNVVVSDSVLRPSASQRRILDRREIDAALGDTTRLLTQAQAVPFLTDGKLDGYRLYSVMPLGFFDKIGLQTNDVLKRVNGVDLRDPSMLLSLFQQLRNERTVRVDLVRNAQPQTVTYEIR